MILAAQVFSRSFYFLGDQDQRSSTLDEVSLLSPANTWSSDGKAVCNESLNQRYSQICSDGNGGAIITWEDYRSGSDYDIYAQKVNSSGDLKWISNGIVISEASENQGSPRICSDGAEGSIITWNDYRSSTTYDIYAQCVDSDGNIKWTVNGSPVCITKGNQQIPQICSDGSGGAIITWTDFNRTSPDYDVYVQRVNSTGDVKWDINGTAICNSSDSQWFPQICTDEFGGAIITWEDYRNGNGDIYAQKVNSTGNIQWTLNGIPICNSSGEQIKPQICSDGFGGAIITWEDNRTTSNYDIYAQRIDANGFIQWAANGTEICVINNIQEDSHLCSDESGGAVIAWTDYRIDSNADIYSQKINSTGNIQWTINGKVICAASNKQWHPQICSNNSGGIIITWEDLRNGLFDVYAQSIDLSADIKWIANGIPICTAFNNQFYPQICSDGTDGAIIAWFDYRSISHSDIYAQFTKFALESPLNGGKTRKFIPFGNYYLIFSVISMISLILIYKRRISTNSNINK